METNEEKRKIYGILELEFDNKPFTVKLKPVSFGTITAISKIRDDYSAVLTKLDKEYEGRLEVDENGYIVNPSSPVWIEKQGKMRVLHAEYNIKMVKALVKRDGLDEAQFLAIMGEPDGEFWQDQDMIKVQESVDSFRQLAIL